MRIEIVSEFHLLDFDEQFFVLLREHIAVYKTTQLAYTVATQFYDSLKASSKVKNIKLRIFK